MDTKVALKEHIQRLKPDVIVIGGFTPSTNRLKADVRFVTDQIREERTLAANNNGNADQEAHQKALDKAEIEIIYVHDDVARLYQNSKRATAEFGEDISHIAKYCIGLARYVQSAVCEYASLGQDLTAINFDSSQKLVSYLQSLFICMQTLIILDFLDSEREIASYPREHNR